MAEEQKTELSEMEQLLNLTKKRLMLQRISTACIAAMLLVVLIVTVTIVPKAVNVITHFTEVAIKAEDSLKQVDEMSTSIKKTSDNVDKLVKENSTQLNDAVQKLADVDYDGLNQAIKDLQETMGPMANFMSRFR